MKEKLKARFGSMRMAAVRTGINYYRLSQIANGWVKPKPEEIKALKLSEKDIKEVARG